MKTKRALVPVQKVDSAIHRLNLYPLDSAIGFPNIYHMDVVFPHSLDVPDCFVVVGTCLMNMFFTFFWQKGIVLYTTKCFV